MREEKKLIFIVPCYNEEETLEYTAGKLIKKLEGLIRNGAVSKDSGICFVDDGSTDDTRRILSNLADTDKRVLLINLSRNYGQQYALLAGIKTVDADMVITIDADLQDSLDSVDEMVAKYHEGFEIVYGCRDKRIGDTLLKRITAAIFYKVMSLICTRTYHNHSEYRLLSRKAISFLKEFNEREIFLRGMISDVGLRSATIIYNRTARTMGKTKYNYFALFKLAWTGISNYSFFPLRLISILGLVFVLISLSAFMVMLVYYLNTDSIERLLILLSFMGFFSGFIILSIGLLGEYIAKILREVKGRPTFQIDSTKNC